MLEVYAILSVIIKQPFRYFSQVQLPSIVSHFLSKVFSLVQSPLCRVQIFMLGVWINSTHALRK